MYRTDETRPSPRQFIAVVLQLLVLLVAIIANGWLMLSVIATEGQIGLPGCSVPGVGCDIVLRSGYSTWFDISVTVWGMLFLVVQLLLLLASWNSKRPATLMIAVSWAALGVAVGIWFFYVMKAMLGSYCTLCLTVHVANFTFFVLTLGRLEFSTDDPTGFLFNGRYRLWKLSTLGLLAVQGLVIFLGTGAGELRLVAVPGVDNPIIFSQLKPGEIQTVKGDPQADRQLVIYTCITCPACRQLNNLLARMENNGELAGTRIDIRFFPLSSRCNPELAALATAKGTLGSERACELTRIALAVATSNRTQFSTLLDWMYQNQQAPISDVQATAIQLIDQQQLEHVLQADSLDQRLEKDLELAKSLQVSQVPQIFSQRGVLTGQLDLAKLRDFFRQSK